MSTAEELLATPCVSKEDVKAMLKKIPGRADLAGRDGFSLAEATLKNIEPRWEALKTEGNAALAAGDLERAIERYTAALDVATQPGPQIRALKAAAAAADEGSPLHRALADPVPVLFKVCEYLPAAPAMNVKRECGPVKMKLTTPNLPAAMSLANRAAARLKAGDAAGARADAALACKRCPEYVKAHKRLRECALALGDRAAAAELATELRDYANAIRLYPWYGPALLGAGWIDHYDHMLVYETARKADVAARIADPRAARAGLGDGATCHAVASLVPFQGGQWLMLNLTWLDAALRKQTCDCFAMAPCDNANDKLLDEPPHGTASPKALRHAPQLLEAELARLKDDFNISVLTLTAGQGLLPHASALNERLKEHVCVGVTPAASTRVSEDMGIPPGAMYLM